MQLFCRLENAIEQIPQHNELEELIEQSLFGDWIIRIEHMGQNGWQQWGSALFAVKSAEPVMQAIYTCFYSHRHHSIRIRAEKVHPQVQLVYSVYEGSLINLLPLKPLKSHPVNQASTGITERQANTRISSSL